MNLKNKYRVGGRNLQIHITKRNLGLIVDTKIDMSLKIHYGTNEENKTVISPSCSCIEQDISV